MEPLLGPVTVVERAPGRFTITGEIDMSTAPRLDELEQVHGPLLVDLHGVTFIDASGIAALVRLNKRCPHHDCTFRIEACSPPVERVLRIVGLYDTLVEDAAPHRSNGDRTAHRSAAPGSHDGAGDRGRHVRQPQTSQA
jgi:anti-sigma B factor antagonist